MSSDVDEQVSRLAHTLALESDPTRAPRQKAYLKSPLIHWGVGVPATRRLLRTWVRGQGDLSRERLWELEHPLWTSPVYEMRSCAVELLAYRTGLLEPVDLPRLRQMIEDSFTWALVDPLAIDVVSSVVAQMESADVDSVLDQWAADDCFWVRRASMLSQLRPLRDPSTDASRFLRYADAMLAEREFFIRKAIGWVLRDMSRKRPVEVYEWLYPRADRASGVTVREAVKYLSPSQRAQINSARG